MRRNRLFAIKPKIFNDKIKLAEIIKKNWKRLFFQEYKRCYWMGDFEKDDIVINIYFQYYVSRRRRMMLASPVEYIQIRKNNKALTVKEIKQLLKENEE